MRRALYIILVSFLSFLSTNAQNWSATIDSSNGLPGEERKLFGMYDYYYFKSDNYTPGGTLDIIRLTVTETRFNQMPGGNNIIFALSEQTVYDGEGNEVEYEASSNADHNSLVPTEIDGGGLPALNDKDYMTHFHSMYRTPAVTDYHYIELKLNRKISTFSLEWTSRLTNTYDAPTNVAISLGTTYDTGFTLGDAATTDNELTVEKQLFVLKGNAVSYFNKADGTTYTGSGPLFMQCAETGDKIESIAHIMQLIPTGDGEYLVYWPKNKKLLKDSHANYNGYNGWQHSTTNIEEAAQVKIAADGKGYFEMKYNTTHADSLITLYIGAEMRDELESKMKTFDLEHKQYLEQGDYSKGFSLPIAFNWSIYKANVAEDKFDELAISMPKIAETILAPTIEAATTYLALNGNFGGMCTNNEDVILQTKIDEGNALINGKATDIKSTRTKKDEIKVALATYLTIKLDKHSSDINTLLQESTFSAAPNYTVGTYPETSKDILNSTLTAIENAKSNATTYTIEQFQSLFTQIERDIELFESTQITETIGGGTGSTDKNPVNDNLICVYLKNGNVDMYEVSAMDGEQYIENGKLYIPLKDDEVAYYTSDEYDSCSTVKPVFPTMTSYKFNNKYNPNLHIDAIADTVTSEMHFSLNSIGKWLTASFTLSDDKAVAYIDTVLQESKVTRQSFADGVTYRVTYPGYNVVKRVKIQDEVWSEPSPGEPELISLTESMISTNKPPREGETVDKLLDNDSQTIFHSTWGGVYDASVAPYLQFELPKAVEAIQLYYMTRSSAYSTGYRNPLGFEIHVSNDGNTWKNIRAFTADSDGLPTQQGNAEYTTPTIDFGGLYSKIRFVQTACEYSKNHLALAELRLYEVKKDDSEPIKIQDAVYANKRVPFGNEYRVNINWLTDILGNVPRIDIDIDNGLFVTSKEYYLDARFRITGYGVYDNFEDSVQIKGRGNSTWSYDKKPYRLKFADKVKPFGMTKGKSWVLLANAQDGSLMANAVSMKIGQMIGAEYTNHIVPVDLYMNGFYMGNYMFTEKVGMANNSVDVSEDQGYLLELDTNSDDVKPFITSRYNLPVFIKEPDLTELAPSVASSREYIIYNEMNRLCETLSNGGDIDNLLDMDAFARYMLANDLSLNQEICHPKSTFLFKEKENSSAHKFKFGPIWDFDWGFGYEESRQAGYCLTGARSSVLNMNFEAATFIRDLMAKESFKRHYYKVWKEFIENRSIDELIDYIDSYYSFAEKSFQKNEIEWGYGDGFTADDRDRMKNWLKERQKYIYENLEEYDLDDLISTLAGDVNCNNQVTIHDVALVTAHVNGNTHASMSNSKADYDKNGTIELADATKIAEVVKSGDAPKGTYWHSTPIALGEFYANDFSLEMGTIELAQLNLLQYNEEQYKAIQFDIELPEDIDVITISSEDRLDSHNLSYIEKENNLYRVIAYSNSDECFKQESDAIISLMLRATNVINEENRSIKIKNVYAVDNENNEKRLQDYTIAFTQNSGITDINDIDKEMLVEGGKQLTVTMLKAGNFRIYSTDGRKIGDINAKEGTTQIELPAGIYIVNGIKVTIRN